MTFVVPGGLGQLRSPFTPGQSWSVRSTNPLPSNYLASVAFGNGIFVLVGYRNDISNGLIASTPNGITFAQRVSTPTPTAFEYVYFVNDMFAVPDGTNTVRTSNDGIVWSASTTLTGVTNILSMIYSSDLGLYVIGGTNAIYTSPNFTTWTQRSTATGMWQFLAYSNGVFVAFNGSTTTSLRSTDGGMTWNNQATPAVMYFLASGNNMFVASAGAGNTYSSSDAITWTPRTLPNFGTGYVRGFVQGLFFVLPTSSTQPNYTSPDGVNWTQMPPFGGSVTITGMAGGNGIVVVSTNTASSVITSP